MRATLVHPGFRLTLDERLADAGVTAIFGANGVGKSTLLRAIAGFETPVAGTVCWHGVAWFDNARGINVPAHRRPAGYLFQDARLFDHLDVMGNLNYAERRCRGIRHMQRGDVVDALDLGPLLKRRVIALSGGERQRVALARTLLASPELLLLDEPLAALDAPRKADILPYLATVIRHFGLPTLYVSHDLDEVAQLADRMLVLADGRVVAHAALPRVLEQLDLGVITGRMENGVLLTGRVAGCDARLHTASVDIGGGQLLTLPLRADLAPGDAVRMRVRARDVALALDEPRRISIRNVLAGTLTRIEVDPSCGMVDAHVALAACSVQARLTLAAVEALQLQPGQRVFALVKSVSFEGP